MKRHAILFLFATSSALLGSGVSNAQERAVPVLPLQVFPPFLRERLNLDEEQQKKLDAMQAEIDAKVTALLNAEQRQMIQTAMQARGGFGGGMPGGPGGVGGPGGPGGGGIGAPAFLTTEIVDRLMEQDKNGDGKLSKEEFPARMQAIFDRADADKDGVVTKDELTKLAAAQAAAGSPGGRGFGGPGGAGGPGGFGGQGGPGGGQMGRGGFGMMQNPSAFVDRLFELDTDKDGKLSREELARISEVMGRPGEGGRGEGGRGEGRPGEGGRGEGGRGNRRPE